MANLRAAIRAELEGKGTGHRKSSEIKQPPIKSRPQQNHPLPSSPPKILLAALLVGLSLIVFTYPVAHLFTAHQNHAANWKVLGVETKTQNQNLPIRLKIPSIQVDASIEYVGVTANGTMAVPSNTVDVGWFSLGSRPGEKGSAVIAGHLNSPTGAAGVFSNLGKLKPGEKIDVEDSAGKTI